MRDGCPVALPRLTSRPSDSSNSVTVAHHFVHLGLNFLPFPMLAHVGGINLVVEVANIADHGTRLEGAKHRRVTNVNVAGGGYQKVCCAE